LAAAKVAIATPYKKKQLIEEIGVKSDAL
jgi:hypothetical protein